MNTSNSHSFSHDDTTMPCTELLVRKSELAITHWRERPHAPLTAGQIRVKIDRFALTANNITYAAFGDAMQYWGFFPVDDHWGIVPVWGFATVIETRINGVAVGERFYGCYPMASHAVLQPTRLSSAGFSDDGEHRASLHGMYNQYTNITTDPVYTATSEDIQALLRPLFFTAWLIDDFFAYNDWFGAGVPPQDALVLISSASSKTAYSTAYQLTQRENIHVVGLTSPANVEFCESLGVYRTVISYGQIADLASDWPCVYIDFSGNAGLRHRLHTHFSNLRFSSAIGGTHLEHLGGTKGLPGPPPTLFFAPNQIQTRSQEWGPTVLEQRLTASWFAFTNHLGHAKPAWLKVVHGQGTEQIQARYLQILAGKTDAQTGYVMDWQSTLSASTNPMVD